MPKFRVTAPNGRTFEVTAPAGTSQADVMAYVKANAGRESAKADFKAKRASDDSNDQSGLTNRILDAATFNMGGELVGGANAAETAVRNLVRRVRGQAIPYTAGDAYQGAMEAFDEGARGAQAAYPKSALASDIGGALFVPGAAASSRFIGEAPNLARTAARAAAVGGGYGAAYGAGGRPENRLGGAVSGATTGAVIGGATPYAAAGVTKAVKAAARPAVNAVARAAGKRAPLATSPELRAARAIQNARARDMVGGAEAAADALPMYEGDNMQALFEVAAKSPGPARTAIRSAVEDNRAATFDAVREDLGKALGGRGDYLSAMDDLAIKRRTDAKAGMERLAKHLVTLDEDSVSAMRSDLAQKAIRDAAQNGLASADPEVRNAAAGLNHLAKTVLDKKSARTITVREAQDISESLLSAADSAYKSGDGARGAALKELGRAIRTNARTPDRGGFSEYDEWLKQYATNTDAQRALELGAEVFGKGLKKSPEAVQRSLSKMGSDAMLQYRKGVAEALMNKLHDSQGDVGLVRRLLKDRNLAAKVALAFPDEASFAAFMDSVERRVQQADINARYMGGSPTYPLQAARADLEAGGEGLAAAAADFLGSGPVAMTSKAAKAALKALPRGQRSALTDPVANAALGRAAGSQAAVDALLRKLQAERRMSLLAGQAGGRAVPVITSRAASN